jgi:hypothetical protein
VMESNIARNVKRGPLVYLFAIDSSERRELS